MQRTNRKYASFSEFDSIRLAMNMGVREFCEFLGTTPDAHWRAFQQDYVSRNHFQAAERLRRFNKPKEGPPPPPLKYVKSLAKEEGRANGENELDQLNTNLVDEFLLDLEELPKDGKKLRK